MKIWKNEDLKDDKIIAIIDETIYKSNPKPDEIDNVASQFKLSIIPKEKIFSIPLRYILAINLQEGKEYIEILFNGDIEHLKIKNEQRRTEIFEYFKSNIPGAVYSFRKDSKLKAVKKPLIAMAVTLCVFFWAVYIAIEKEKGADYDVTGQHYHSMAGIILVLASLGTKNLVLIFSSLFTVIVISFLKKIKNIRPVQQIIIRR